MKLFSRLSGSFRPTKLLLELGTGLFLLTPGIFCLSAQEPRPAKPDASILFREEMARVPERLKWKGERLSDDTLYAAALTGASWELSWGKETLFSLAWGDGKRIANASPQAENYIALVHQIQNYYEQKQYREAVQTALNHFSLDQIGCDPFLKEPVGLSFMAQGQPEQAFPILAAPFEPPHSQVNVADLNRRFREDALEAAERAGLTREAVAFALSLVLDPGTVPARPSPRAMLTLERQGVDLDRVLLGILEAPDRMRGLPLYVYSAADLLCLRASPRLLPVFLHLARSDDAYLRGRALLGLGIVGYQARPEDPSNWAQSVLSFPLREFGISTGERKLMEKEIRDGLGSDKYRVRTSAALALALMNAEGASDALQKMAKDRSYLLTLSPGAPANSRLRRILFPVRNAVSLGLARYGVRTETEQGDFEGKALENARRGGQDETTERRSLRRDSASQIQVTLLDPVLAPPADSKR